MRHEPRGLLRDHDIPIQLHQGDAFQAGNLQVDRYRPLPQRHLGPPKRRYDPDRKRLPAGPAPVGQIGRVRRFGGFGIAASWAMTAVRPALFGAV